LAQTNTDLSEIIAENFGANATYVEGLLGRFRSNPELVDESWRSYFTELLGADGGDTGATVTSTTSEVRDSRSTDNGGSETATATAPTRAAEKPSRQPHLLQHLPANKLKRLQYVARH
jgi:2-oxoglutarate dehydrogenase complex dehydrogenase (E1) component-like enzyme